jgi:hypothetical protein
MAAIQVTLPTGDGAPTGNLSVWHRLMPPKIRTERTISMNVSKELDFELEDLPVDVFELDGSGLTVESLTAGHGMAELGASSICTCTCPSLCSCIQPN